MPTMAIAAYNRKIAREIENKVAEDAVNGFDISRLSPQQEAVRQWVMKERGSARVTARAGTGKTTLLRAVVDTLKIRPRVSTFHGFGWGTIRYAYKNAKIEGNERDAAGYMKFDRIKKELDLPIYLEGFVFKLLDLAKQRGIGPLLSANDIGNWEDIVYHFDLDEILSEHQDHNSNIEELRHQGIQWAYKALRLSNNIAHEVIDFADMLYVPLAAKMRMYQNDWVLVDEAQDTNPVRRAMAKMMLRPGGRAIFVGDDRQAIYGFTGADNDALDVISREFNCKEFPLTVTFRCPQVVVGLAREMVPDYEAHPSNEEGIYEDLNWEQFNAMELVPGDDAIICRNTKPLVQMAYKLIKRGIPSHVEGREIGKSLIKLINRFKKVETLADLCDRLDEYAEAETAKLLAKGKELQAEGLADRVETIKVIIESLPPDAEIADLRSRIEGMFADTPEGKRPKTITLMTAHRSKGLEFPRIFIMGRSVFMPSKFARQSWQIQQESNLEYVAITRAMKCLYDIPAL